MEEKNEIRVYTIKEWERSRNKISAVVGSASISLALLSSLLCCSNDQRATRILAAAISGYFAYILSSRVQKRDMDILVGRGRIKKKSHR